MLEVAARGEISMAPTEAFRLYVPFLPRASLGVLMVAIGPLLHPLQLTIPLARRTLMSPEPLVALDADDVGGTPLPGYLLPSGPVFTLKYCASHTAN